MTGQYAFPVCSIRENHKLKCICISLIAFMNEYIRFANLNIVQS
ncbi:hypothetical protein SynRCC2555_00054 [Synechococcus sp. WH 8101]|nr:hypothetical protein SynRCC2555_00054 [Synechococcus sp. WH 8101]